MRPRALALHAGSEARARVLAEGLHPGLFDVLVGASGGAKWLVLSALDQLLFPWLLRDRLRPLACVGSSIGAWRHLCLAQPDPAAATVRLRDAYIDQSYEDGAGTADVSRVSRGILQRVLGASGAARVVEHAQVHTHVLAVRACGPWRSGSGAGLIAATAGTAFSNLLSRRALAPWMERHCFHAGPCEAALGFGAFPTRHVALSAGTLPSALMASGSI
ncbi:MAG: patatin-like phospholipase family protein, partial [Gammaproteobacteria bacterium]